MLHCNRLSYQAMSSIQIDFDIDNILINKKSYETILVYNILYKTLIGTKPLYIRFNKVDGFIRVYDETRC